MLSRYRASVVIDMLPMTLPGDSLVHGVVLRDDLGEAELVADAPRVERQRIWQMRL